MDNPLINVENKSPKLSKTRGKMNSPKKTLKISKKMKLPSFSSSDSSLSSDSPPKLIAPIIKSKLPPVPPIQKLPTITTPPKISVIPSTAISGDISGKSENLQSSEKQTFIPPSLGKISSPSSSYKSKTPSFQIQPIRPDDYSSDDEKTESKTPVTKSSEMIELKTISPESSSITPEKKVSIIEESQIQPEIIQQKSITPSTKSSEMIELKTITPQPKTSELQISPIKSLESSDVSEISDSETEPESESESESESVKNIKKSREIEKSEKEFIFEISKSLKKKTNQSLQLKDENELKSIQNFNNTLQETKSKIPSSENILETKENAYQFLYPTLNDPEFNIKIASKKEFGLHSYTGEIASSIEDIKEFANKMCDADFELASHQLFVRNFLSFQTPYNSLLLYHGLGTGKTCSAITVAEEMRDYLKQIGLNTEQKIIIVASPNVQENFKLQLFDRRKLRLIDGLWNIRSCTGNKFLKEINPMNMKGLSEDKVVSQIKKIIKNSYLFLGYEEFSKYIRNATTIPDEIKNKQTRNTIMIQKLKKLFGNRLVIIDEIHNIRNTDDNSVRKSIAGEFYKLVQFSEFLQMRLLLLSGTPMYNSYKEIIWLLNIMRLNDGRSEIQFNEIFNKDPDKDGIFIETTEADGTIVETGKDNLRRYATGYISYLKGENPYLFPYTIYPYEFSPQNTFKDENNPNGLYIVPTKQLNGKKIPEYRELDELKNKLFISSVNNYQKEVYKFIIKQIKSKPSNLSEFETNESIGFTILQRPLEALNIVYPYEYFKGESQELQFEVKNLLGKKGLENCLDYNHETKRNFEYKPNIPAIFSKNQIENYSSKIKSITNSILLSEGIILIYSFYIDGGVVPVALALEELGFTRYGTKNHSLFKNAPVPPIDSLTYKTRSEMIKGETFFPAKYVIISGDPALSPDNLEDVKAVTNDNNSDGRFVKVVIISKSGTEGLDFKNIRQVHILEPWYNINLIDQTKGRAVRNCSHRDLPFEKRNVEIYMHASTLENDEQDECADVYLYRLCERKAKQIGQVSRVLKEGAVDCILNSEQQNFSAKNFSSIPVIQILSSKDKEGKQKQLEFVVGDKDNSGLCDYMQCEFKCIPDINKDNIGIKSDAYTDILLSINTDKITQKIRDLFQERHFYKRTATSKTLDDKCVDLISCINKNKKYPIESIDVALTQLIENKSEFIKDKYGRYGHLVNIGDYYFFQPLELNNEIIPLFERQIPIDYKREKIIMKSQPEIIMESLAPSMVSTTIATKVGEKEGKPTIMTKEPLIIQENRENYKNSLKINKVQRGNDNWYYNIGFILEQKLGFLTEKERKEIIISHIVELLNINEQLIVLNYLLAIEKLEEKKEDEFIELMTDYFNKYKLEGKMGLEGILLIDKEGIKKLYIKDIPKNIWIPGGSQDIQYFKDNILEKLVIKDKEERLNQIIGFITALKNDFLNLTFKTKKMIEKKGLGSSKAISCDKSGKKEVVSILNDILNNNMIYIFDNLKDKEDYINALEKLESIDKNNINEKVIISLYINLLKIDSNDTFKKNNTTKMNHTQMCILQEVLLRYFNSINRNEKVWFLTPIQALINTIESSVKK